MTPPAWRGAGGRLFALSFIALFLELMVIRWVPSEVRLVAYYANLMLLSSFLGLGVGAILSGRDGNLFRWMPLALTLGITLLALSGQISLPNGDGEWRFFHQSNRFLGYLILVSIFAVNAGIFVPLGEEIGRQFRRLPNLKAYAWDLGGSIAGTVGFAVFSYIHFSPLIGLTVVAIALTLLSAPARRLRAALLFVVALGALGWSTAQNPALWSPYYFITTHQSVGHMADNPDNPDSTTKIIRFEEVPVSAPFAGLREMRNPPSFTIKVNQDFYQSHGTIDPARYDPGSIGGTLAQQLFSQYQVPHLLRPGAGNVLVLGAGGGQDIEAALLNGAERVVAVDIDPVIPTLSNQFSAAAPYEDPRVELHIDDARAFLQRTDETFDLIVFGFLDSQALASYGSSLRLDGYTYTVESLRRAYGQLNEGGMLTVCFYVGQEWLAQRLVQMAAVATERPPIAYVQDARLIVSVIKVPYPQIPPTLNGWAYVEAPMKPVDLATDDWPYLYLEAKTIPRDYLIVIGLLVVGSLGILLPLRKSSFGLADGHFLFMGWGFLLLQTKSIGDCALYFGNTWLVTSLVILGILLMVWAANALALRWPGPFRPWLYVPLFVTLVILLFVPREWVLGQPMIGRIIWTLLVVPLPVFFAGLIFSKTFDGKSNPAALFGANLIGATLGGFSEYLGMWTGHHALNYLVLIAYGASLLCCLMLSQRRTPGW